MIHYTCDRCRKIIETEHETRYSVRIEVQANLSEREQDDLPTEEDQINEIEAIIQQLEDPDYEVELPDDLLRRREFDLCSKCYAVYMLNPLAMEPTPQFRLMQ